MLGRENGELLAPFLPHFLIFYTFPNTSASTAISFVYCPYTRSRVAPGDRLFSGCPEKTAECGVLRPRPRTNAEAAAAGWGRRGPVTCPAFPPAPEAQPPSRRRAAPQPPGFLKGSVSGTTTKWLSLPGRLRSSSIGPFPPPPPSPLAGSRSLDTGLARAAVAHPRSRRSRFHGDQDSVRRGCWGLENRAELVEPSKS